MKNRKAAVELINRQLNNKSLLHAAKHEQWHYGRVELHELMDFVYERTPHDASECISLISNQKSEVIDE